MPHSDVTAALLQRVVQHGNNAGSAVVSSDDRGQSTLTLLTLRFLDQIESSVDEHVNGFNLGLFVK